MSFYYNIRDKIGNIDSVEAYTHFRHIEDWCNDNLLHSQWKFDHSGTVCVYGVDIPRGIEFKNLQDVIEFNLNC